MGVGGGGGGGSNVDKIPCPFSICHWNLRGNLFEKFLLQAFLSVHDFDIVLETHLSSRIGDNELYIEGYSFQWCGRPNDNSWESPIPFNLKPVLSKLKETLVRLTNFLMNLIKVWVILNPHIKLCHQ